MLFSKFLMAAPVAAYLKLDIHRREDNDSLPLINAQGAPVGNNIGFWTTNASIGTPPQDLTLVVSLNWGDTYLNTFNNSDCKASIGMSLDDCNDLENFQITFNPNVSSTFNYNISAAAALDNRDHEMFYYYNSWYKYQIDDAAYGSDTIRVGNIEIKDLKIGVSLPETGYYPSILGLGNKNLETTLRFGFPYSYPNFVTSLKNSGLIKKEAFSLYFPSADSDNGEILFGAVDQAKFYGSLTTLPYIYDYEMWDSKRQNAPTVTSSSMGYRINGKNGTFETYPRTPLSFWYESQLTYFDSSITEALQEILGLETDFDNDWFYTNCSALENAYEDYILINFQGTTIQFPLMDLYYYQEDNKCYMSFASQSGGTVLGGPLLKSLYVVLDNENYEISVAQAKFTDDSDIVEIDSDIAGASSAEDYTVTWKAGDDPLTIISSGVDVFTLVTTTYQDTDLGMTGTVSLPTQGNIRDVDSQSVTLTASGSGSDDDAGSGSDSDTSSATETSSGSSSGSSSSASSTSGSASGSSMSSGVESTTETNSPTSASSASSSSSTGGGPQIIVDSGLFGLLTLLLLSL